MHSLLHVGSCAKDIKDIQKAGMQSEREEIRRCKTESELDLWVQKNIVKYFASHELQRAVFMKRYEIINQ